MIFQDFSWFFMIFHDCSWFFYSECANIRVKNGSWPMSDIRINSALKPLFKLSPSTHMAFAFPPFRVWFSKLDVGMDPWHPSICTIVKFVVEDVHSPQHGPMMSHVLMGLVPSRINDDPSFCQGSYIVYESTWLVLSTVFKCAWIIFPG